MGRVVSDGKFTIYVYVERGGKHHKPHCYVVWADGETILEIPSLNRITGDPLPRAGLILARAYLDAIADKWEELNDD